MLIEAFLCRLVVIRHHDQHRVRADGFAVPGKLDGFRGRVGTGAGDHRHALVCRLHTDLHDPFVFGVADSWRFSRGTDRYEAMRALRNLPFDKSFEGRFIQLAVFERCNERWD